MCLWGRDHRREIQVLPSVTAVRVILGLTKYADPEDGHQAHGALRQMWSGKASRPRVQRKHGLQWEESFHGRKTRSDRSHHPKGNTEFCFPLHDYSSFVAAPRPMNYSTQWSFLPGPMCSDNTAGMLSLSGSGGNRGEQFDRGQVCPLKKKGCGTLCLDVLYHHKAIP